MAKKQESAHGPCPFVVAVGCSDPDHHPARDLLALTGAIMAYSTTSPTSRAVPAAAVVADAAASAASAVSWAAIFAGAFGAVAVSIILIELGLGLGFSSTSAWPNSGATLGTLGVMGGVWLILTQWIASGIGGYIAGRVRTKWTGLHTDEVFFRDTAHGFLVWALASVLVAAVATSAISSAVSTAGSAVSTVASGATQAAADQSGAATQYFTDSLFRADQPKEDASPQEATGEAGRILARSIANGNLEPSD